MRSFWGFGAKEIDNGVRHAEQYSRVRTREGARRLTPRDGDCVQLCHAGSSVPFRVFDTGSMKGGELLGQTQHPVKPKAQRAPSSAETPDHVDFHGGTARPRLRLVPQVAESWIPRYRRAAAALDLTVAALAVALTAAAARWFDLEPFSPTAAGLLVVLGALGWLGALAQSGAYERRMLGVGTEEFAAMPRAAIRLLAVGALCGAIAYDLLPSGSRLLVLIALPLALVGSLLSRYVLRKRLHRSRILHGTAMQRAVIMGDRKSVV